MSEIIYRLCEDENVPLNKIGGASAHVLIIIEKVQYVDNTANAIAKMISALGLSMENDVQVALVESGNPSLRLNNIDNRFTEIISIGIPVDRLGLQIELDKYNIGRLETFSIMHTDDMTTILGTQKLKNIFWGQLKKQFNK